MDSADVDDIRSSGLLGDLIDHEIGHALGIGIWTFDGGDGGPWQLAVGTDTNDPRFVGRYAVDAYHNLGGSDPDIPVANTGAAGTEDSHWREATFDDELMTGFLNSGDNPASTMTVASLADQFYAVDTAGAEAYTLPSTSSSLVQGDASGGGTAGGVWLGEEHWMSGGVAYGGDERGRVLEIVEREVLRGSRPESGRP